MNTQFPCLLSEYLQAVSDDLYKFLCLFFNGRSSILDF